MDRNQIARGVAAQLFEAENALDEAIMAFSRLSATAMEARVELNLSAMLGADVVTRAAAVQTQLAAARGEAGVLHGALADLARRIRVRADGEDYDGLGAGDKHDPRGQALPAGARPLRAVRELQAS